MLAHLGALGAGFLVIVAVSAAWIVNLQRGPRLDGFTGGITVVFVPMVLLMLGAGWLAVRAIAGRWKAWTATSVLLVTAGISYVLTAITCGPIACFQPGPNRAMGWFVVGGLTAIAAVHHAVLGRLRR